jgi:hypothetical protein
MDYLKRGRVKIQQGFPPFSLLPKNNKTRILLAEKTRPQKKNLLVEKQLCPTCPEKKTRWQKNSSAHLVICDFQFCHGTVFGK